ncbi:uroporphyrinogen decarboxylase [Ktedonosporobacter rubrisoli]|uniref:Uroporphyrinogen decarboxylase n=1 Tax=Ktedonosporobacter rubrisoli TaxID=2509675 RepID=A0A4V0YZG2_KTERU|nr:uroporphyrinogen decarboxylase [Ktedonosporobacter rubrisoli]QBD79611.1 uroporphyrinogen decarboxylase [Ktedonosporobacter rubrisoli]
MQEYTFPAVAAARTGAARFMNACHHRQPDATPVWFMRQAGRCLPEYRALRSRYDSMMTMVRAPEISAQVTLMPIKAFGVDAAVIYSDIMLPLEEMGMNLEIKPDIGPVIHNPVRSLADIAALRVPSSEEITPYVMESIGLVRRELAGQQAVIGFAGAPFTLASYMIEGGPSRDYRQAKAMMYGQPELWDALMSKLADVVAHSLVAQVRAGADVVQVFDSWIGALNPHAYRRFVQPYMRRIFAAVKQTGAPAIHFGTGTAALLEAMAEAGGDIISIDWHVELDEAWARVGFERGVQGNLDPTLLLTSWPTIEAGMQDVLRRAANRPGHIFNLGHGVLPATDPGLLRQLVEAVHEATQR